MIDPVLLELPRSIETERLRMRPPEAGDGAALMHAITDSLPELRRFLASMPWVAGEQTIEASELFCRNGQANFIARKDLPFLLFEKASGQLVGVAGLHRPVWSTPKAEVGYWSRTSRARSGFITEAVQALCQYGFAHLKMARIERRAPSGDLRKTCLYARLPPGP